jgi:gp178
MNGLIEIGDKVVLYGFFDGFAHKTDGTTNGLVTLKTGERVEIPLEDIMKKDQIITKKDIISRMKQLFPLSRNEWINEILHEFGDEFGLWKYNAGYEQGKLEGEWVGQQLKDADKIRQELNKPVVKQFVADWYEENKDNLEFNIFDYVYRFDQNAGFDFKDWFDDFNTKPIQTLVNMHQFGYEVEKDKRYEVLLCNGQSLKTVYRQGGDRLDFEKVYGDLERFTRKQLEDAGLGWAFDCPGIEIREVEG